MLLSDGIRREKNMPIKSFETGDDYSIPGEYFDEDELDI